MSFNQVFSKSWKDYTSNFRTIFQLTSVYYILPLFLLSLIVIFLMNVTGLFQDLLSIYSLMVGASASGSGQIDPATSAALSQLMLPMIGKFFLVFIPASLLVIVFLFLTLFLYLAVLVPAFKKTTFTYHDAVTLAKPLYWRFVGLTCMLWLISLGLYLVAMMVLFIPLTAFAAILGPTAATSPYFTVLSIVVSILMVTILLFFLTRFLFAPCFMVQENEKVFASLEKSWKFVQGRWWNAFGYIILLTLIFWVVWLLASLPLQSLFALFLKDILVGNFGLLWILLLLYFLMYVLFTLIGLLWAFFLKNLYLSYSKSRRK